MNVILYIATSLDGMVAREDGDVDWLHADSSGETYGYEEFLAGVDSLVMGRTTYDQILGFGEWPYEGKQTYVLTSREYERDRDDIHFIAGSTDEILSRIEKLGGKNIWLVGGANVAEAFFQAKRIGSLILTIIPILLGDGISLFNGSIPETSLELLSSKSYDSGIVQLEYRVK